MLYFQEAIAIKEEQISTLREHLKNVEKKAVTGSATQYEILSTKVRISTVESQKTDVFTSLNFQNSYLNMLLGEPVSIQHRVRNLLHIDLISFSEDSLISIALSNRNELKISEKNDAFSGLSRFGQNEEILFYLHLRAEDGGMDTS